MQLGPFLVSRFQILENECGQEHQYQTNEALMNKDDSVYHEMFSII